MPIKSYIKRKPFKAVTVMLVRIQPHKTDNKFTLVDLNRFGNVLTMFALSDSSINLKSIFG